MLKATHGFRHVLSLALLGLVGLLLAGCGGGGGGGDNESAFVAAPLVSFAATNATVSPTGTAQLAVVLDRPAPRSFSLNLVVTGDREAFSVPASVSVSDKQTSVVFSVAATGAAVGSSISVQMVAGSGYRVGGPASAAVTVGTDDLAEVRLVGGNATLSPGSSTAYALVLDQPSPTPLTVNLLAVGDTGQFTLPGTVTIGAGQLAANFSVTAATSAALGASVQFSVLGGLNYAVGTPSSATVNVGAGLAPQVSLVGGDTSLAPGASTNYSLVLNQPAPSAISVNLAVAGNSDQFSVPSNVIIPAGQSSASLPVSVSAAAPLGASVDFSIVAGPGYAIGAPSAARVTVGAGVRPTVRIEGGNRSLEPGDTTIYALVLNQPAPIDTEVSLLAVGDVSQFSVPATVVIPAGVSAVNFEITASLGATVGEVRVFIVPGLNYLVGTPQAVTVNVSSEGGFDFFEGTGSEVIPFEVTSGGAVTFDLRHTGPGVFFVDVLDSDANQVGSSLVIDSGDVDATVVRNLQAGSYLLSIEAGGSWGVRITQPSDSGPGAGPVPSQIRLSADKVQVVADNVDRAALEILVQDDGSVGIEDVPVLVTVEPSAFDLRMDAARTDASGRITGTLSSGFDLLSGNALVTAQAGALTRTIGIRFVGSTLVATPDTLELILGEVQQIQLAARSGANEPATNLVLCVELPVQLRSDDLEAIPGCATGVRTDGAGIATVQVEAESLLESGTIRVTALGQELDIPVSVRPEAIVFIQPPADSAFRIDEPVDVELEIPEFAGNVLLGTTSGSLASNGASTSILGPPYTDAVQSGTMQPGRVTLLAEKQDGSGDRARTSFLAFDPSPLRSDEVILSITASPRTLQAGSAVTASIDFSVQRIDGGAVPPDTLVWFRFPGPSRGAQLESAFAFVSQEDSKARTQLRAGSEASPEEGVTVEACLELDDVGETCRSVSVIITDRPAALSIGLANEAEAIADGTAYAFPISVIATDIGGQALENPVDISLSVWPIRYAIGLRLGGSPDTANGAVFVNEDVNRNVARDLDDLWSAAAGMVGGMPQAITRSVCDPPGAPATEPDPLTTNSTDAFENRCRLLPASTDAGALESAVVRTDENGLALFRLRYLKDRAEFVTVELRASAQVQGTEVQVSRIFTLPRLAADTNLPPSPFNAFFDEFE